MSLSFQNGRFGIALNSANFPSLNLQPLQICYSMRAIRNQNRPPDPRAIFHLDLSQGKCPGNEVV